MQGMWAQVRHANGGRGRVQPLPHAPRDVCNRPGATDAEGRARGSHAAPARREERRRDAGRGSPSPTPRRLRRPDRPGRHALGRAAGLLGADDPERSCGQAAWLARHALAGRAHGPRCARRGPSPRRAAPPGRSTSPVRTHTARHTNGHGGEGAGGQNARDVHTHPNTTHPNHAGTWSPRCGRSRACEGWFHTDGDRTQAQQTTGS